MSLMYLRNLIHILGLDDGFQIILQDFGEVVLELAAPKVGQDLRPVGRVLELAQVGLLLPGQNFERGRFADAVGAHQAQHLTRPRNRQPVQFERILRVAVGCALLQVATKKNYN